MSKYTPGPWATQHSAGHERHGQSIVYPEGERADISKVYDGDKNANLIAAAPDLYEACRAMLERINTMTTEDFSRGAEKPERVAMTKAIAKAEGNA